MQANRLSVDTYVAECFIKCGGVILASRLHKPVKPTADKRSARWFHLDFDEIQTPGMEVEQWRRSTADPMVLEFYLNTQTSGMPPGATPALPPSSSLDILLERWTLQFHRPGAASAHNASPSSQAPTGSSSVNARAGGDELVVYKRMLLLVRCLYTFLRTLPAYKICSTVQKGDTSTPFRISYRVLRGTSTLGDANNKRVFAHSRMKTFEFSPVEAASGAFHIAVEYETAVKMKVPEQMATSTSAPAIILDYIGSASPAFPFQAAPASNVAASGLYSLHV